MSELNVSMGDIRVEHSAGQTGTAASNGTDNANCSVWDRGPQLVSGSVAPAPPVNVPVNRNPEPTEHTKRMRANFNFFGPVTFLYALFYAFCMFRNGSGVTFPFFVAGSLLYLCFSLSKLEISLKKGSAFYMISMMLLAVSTFCTDDGRIIAFNKSGIFLLMMSLLLKQFFDTSQWKLGKYLLAICQLVFASLGELGRPFGDMSAYRKTSGKKQDSRIWYVVLGVVIAVPLMLIVLLLLTSADAVFRNMAGKVLQNINMGNIFNVAVRIVFLYFASYILLSYLCKHMIKETVKDNRTGEPVLAITITGMLSMVYLLFSGVQIIYLFLGKMQLPEGYTYAEYARQGFFQLLAVSILNLVIVLFTMSYFRESKVLKSVLTVMSLCTFIMIASSALRMIIYIQYYYLTFLRILVLWSLAVLTLLFLGVIVSIFRESFPLFRYSMTVVTILYLALSFSHPDYIIARVNVANAVRGSAADRKPSEGDFFKSASPYEDYAYLSHLSADAAPVLIPYLVDLEYDINVFYEDDILTASGGRGGRSGRGSFGYQYLNNLQEATENFSLRTFNVSKYMALQKIAEYSPQAASMEYLSGIVIQNDADTLFTEADFSIYINERYVGASSVYQEDIDAYFIRTADDGCLLNMDDYHITKPEMPLLQVYLTLTFLCDGEYHKVSAKLAAEEDGTFPLTYALRKDSTGEYAIVQTAP